MIENLKSRLSAKKYNLCTEQLDLKRNYFISDYWIYKDVIYFGHPLGIFFKSNINKFKL